MREVGRGMRVFEHAAVRGVWRVVRSADDAGALVDHPGPIVASIRDPGATFLRPLYDVLAAVVCSTGTPRSHIGIIAGNLGIPCVVAASFPGEPPPEGAEVEVDCTGDDGIVRA